MALVPRVLAGQGRRADRAATEVKTRLWIEAFWALAAIVNIACGVHDGDGVLGAIGGALLALVYRDVRAELHLMTIIRERK